jgi:chromosome segregation protein
MHPLVVYEQGVEVLKLKKLQILGFKSFCDRTELKFHGEGIAAIVGPNGCGKSNISDAIAWVLGEQSAKTLRGSRMEDVIFNGTPQRKPTGMAEVSLTLIDPEVYEGGHVEEPEIELCDEYPDDWDEAQARTAAEAETDQYTEEVRPGVIEDQPMPASPSDAASGTQTAAAAQSAPPPASAEAAPDPEGAKVVLKIRRRKFQAKYKAGEVQVTRRLFRSGDSEYLLNGKLCRLRDIQEIFMGTGLGPESYALIEQGRIGQILSSKPTDRRAIIEEAAGITKFKTKKRLAEARLEESKINLSRVNDIFDEVTRQMNSLKRQAAKAARFARLRDEMRGKLRLVLASRFAQLEREAAELRGELDSLSEQLRARSQAVQQMEAEQAGCTQRGYEIERDARVNRERINAIGLETGRLDSRRRSNVERCAELETRSAAAQQELEQAGGKLAELEAECECNRAVLDSASAEVAAAQQDLTRGEQDEAAAARALAETERTQEQRRSAIFEAVAAAANIRNQITQAQERMAALDREAQRLAGEIESGNLQVETFGGERGQIAFQFESSSQRVAALAQQIGDLRSSLEDKRAGETDSKRRLDTLRAEHATLLGKKASLESVIAEHGYSTESVRRLFQSGALQNGFAPVGVLADFVEVEDRYEHVVEDFLRDELNYIVVKSWDAANEGLRLLRTGVDGRATFLVHPNDSQAKFSFAVNESAPQTVAQDRVVPLKHSIRVLNGFGKSLEVILPKLRDGYIAPDPGVARELALENPDAFFLAQSGECFHNVTVTGGKQRSEGPLSMKRELREVARQIEDIQRALGDEEARVLTLGREIAGHTALLERLEAEKREAQTAAMTSGHSLKQLDSELSRISERLATYKRERQRVATERAETEALSGVQRSELAASEQRRAELEQAMAAAQENMAGLRAARQAAAYSASERKARLAALEERHRAAASTLARVDSLVAEVAGRVNALNLQIQSAAAEQQQRQADNVQIEERVAALAAECGAAEARAAELEAESQQLRARLAELEDSLRSARQELDAARDRRGEISAALAKLDSDRQHLSETSVNELGTPPQELLAGGTVSAVSGEELAQEEAGYRDLRAKLDAIGPVNMMALEEYNEVAQRHEFLETQRKDLLESIENTQNTIREIEIVSRQKFQEAFEKINENFQAAFKKLFGGGHAFMRLTDELNAESGIDVVASPPGKKLQNVLLLSGGEKALTALALLVGIFQYQPSPFCILDEVDAPLDEANIGRFTELVREMSMQTQFVLITHSRKTMSIAPVMYGVTMQEPGISKLVSVRFNEAQAAG